MQKVKYETPFVFHYREGQSRGGLTIVFDPKARLFGISKCSSRDNYNKRLGRLIAMGRIQKGKGQYVKSFIPSVTEEKSVDDIYIEDINRQADQIAVQYGNYTDRKKPKTVSIGWI